MWGASYFDSVTMNLQCRVLGVRCQQKITRKLKPETSIVTPNHFAIFTHKAIQLCTGPEEQVFSIIIKNQGWSLVFLVMNSGVTFTVYSL